MRVTHITMRVNHQNFPNVCRTPPSLIWTAEHITGSNQPSRASSDQPESTESPNFQFLQTLSQTLSPTLAVLGFFEGFRVAGNTPATNNLQFADDTLIFYGEEDHIRNVKATLLCFEVVSGLQVNFCNSELIGIRMERSLLHKYASIWVVGWVICQLLI